MRDFSSPHIRIFSPSSSEGQQLTAERLRELGSPFAQLSYHSLAPQPTWPFVAASLSERLDQLIEGISQKDVTALWAARGGYGASDLLDHIPWHALAQLEPLPIVGFSDVSALHSAFYTRLGWSGIHGPMPATEYWGQHGHQDTDALIALLRGETPSFSLPLLYLGRGLSPRIEGWGFGGCLAVLSSLIGTPYFPPSLEGAIVYWEDIGEHPARVLRYCNQWLQSGAFKGVKGLVLGRFVSCEVPGQFSESQLHQQLASRLSIPVWFCPHFGHCSPNWPLPIGRGLRIDGESLSWNWETAYG